jgi:DNA-binding response OmpR family regulator
MMHTGRDAGPRANVNDRTPSPTEAVEHVSEPGIQRATRSGTLIAIVEDDSILASTFQQVLEEERGWDTMVVGDGEEALHVLPSAQPDMILLDVTLPGLDGVSLYRMLRGRRETWATPILIVTASHEWELQRLGLEANALLRKPFDIDDLLAAVERLLNERPTQAAAQ